MSNDRELPPFNAHGDVPAGQPEPSTIGKEDEQKDKVVEQEKPEDDFEPDMFSPHPFAGPESSPEASAPAPATALRPAAASIADDFPCALRHNPGAGDLPMKFDVLVVGAGLAGAALAASADPAAELVELMAKMTVSRMLERNDFSARFKEQRPIYQHEFLYQLYLHADPHYSGRVTVPVLWDKKNHTIVSNESAEIIRMFNTAFDALGAKAGDYYPPALQSKIDELNGWIYDNVNNGVYKAGFATSQEAYDDAVEKVFQSLARLEQILGQHRFLTGDQLTEADIRLWTTLVRFDPVYVTHFKCDKHRISDYLNLYGFLRDIYQMPGIAETVNFDHIRNHYFRSHKTINPTGIISVGPWQDLNEPHGRDDRFA